MADSTREKTTVLDMTEGSIPGKLIMFAIPLLLGNLFQQLYNTADSLIVGNFLGASSLAAVTSTGSLIFLLIGFFNGMAMGAGVIISRFFGAKDHANLKRAIHTDLAFGLTCGIVLSIFGALFAPHILKLMGTPDDVLVQATGYIRIYFCGATALVMYNVCNGILQAVGDSRHPLYYLIFSSCVNIALDLLFCGVLRLGVAFAAVATIISQFLSVLMCLTRLMRVNEVYRVELKSIGFDKNILKLIIRIGVPSGIQNSIISLANVVVQSNINSFGSNAMAGCGSYSKVEGFGFLPITCFSMSLTTFVSQNIGAGKIDRVKKGAAFGMICGIICSECIGICIRLFGPHLIGLFNADPAVVEYGVRYTRVSCIFYFLLATSHLTAGVLRGAGKAIVPMYVMMVCWCLIRITYITVTIHFIPQIEVIFWAYPLTWSLSTMIFLIYLAKGKWLRDAEQGKVFG